MPSEKFEVYALAKVDQSVLFLREWEEVGDMGVGGGGPGLASVGVEGVEGAERLVELEGDDGEAASSQVSATASDVLGLTEVEMARFLKESSSPWWLSVSPDRNKLVLLTWRSTRCGCHCCFHGRKAKALAFQTKSLILGNQCKEAAHRKQRMINQRQ